MTTPEQEREADITITPHIEINLGCVVGLVLPAVIVWALITTLLTR